MQTAVFSSTNHRSLVWFVHRPVLDQFAFLFYVRRITGQHLLASRPLLIPVHHVELVDSRIPIRCDTIRSATRRQYLHCVTYRGRQSSTSESIAARWNNNEHTRQRRQGMLWESQHTVKEGKVSCYMLWESRHTVKEGMVCYESHESRVSYFRYASIIILSLSQTSCIRQYLKI